jgi:hypothetical protein
VGLPQDQRRAPEAWHRRLGDDDRHRASPRRPGLRAPPDRADLGGSVVRQGLTRLDPRPSRSPRPSGPAPRGSYAVTFASATSGFWHFRPFNRRPPARPNRPPCSTRIDVASSNLLGLLCDIALERGSKITTRLGIAASCYSAVIGTTRVRTPIREGQFRTTFALGSTLNLSRHAVSSTRSSAPRQARPPAPGLLQDRSARTG